MKTVKRMVRENSFQKLATNTKGIFVEIDQKDFVSFFYMMLNNIYLEHVIYEDGRVVLGEMKDLNWHGKRTAYFDEGEVEN